MNKNKETLRASKQIVMSGIRPTGFLHLGNYFGAIRNYVKMQDDYECYFMVADLHSLTTHPDTSELKSNVHRVLAENIACGLDPERVALYCQSHLYQTGELYLYLNMLAYKGELEKTPTFKDKVRQHPNNVNAGLLTYPVLMAADILIHRAKYVPVGKDQEQHLEIARNYVNLARSLGSDESSLDIMGIEISRLNAMLLSAALGDSVYPVIPTNLEEMTIACESGKIIVSGGLHPGQSTNATSALICEKIKADRFLNATDVNGIYDSDPNKNPKAKMFREITIKKCMGLLNNESTQAGSYDLMDIVALKVIERSKIPTRVIKSDPKVIRNLVMKNSQSGTKITA